MSFNIYDHVSIEDCEMCGSDNIKNGKVTQSGKKYLTLLRCENCGHKWKLSIPKWVYEMERELALDKL